MNFLELPIGTVFEYKNGITWTKISDTHVSCKEWSGTTQFNTSLYEVELKVISLPEPKVNKILKQEDD